MRIGIISDTHDNVPMVQRAVEIFNAEAVDLVLHEGDYVSPFAVKPLSGLTVCPVPCGNPASPEPARGLGPPASPIRHSFGV